MILGCSVAKDHAGIKYNEDYSPKIKEISPLEKRNYFNLPMF